MKAIFFTIAVMTACSSAWAFKTLDSNPVIVTGEAQGSYRRSNGGCQGTGVGVDILDRLKSDAAADAKQKCKAPAVQISDWTINQNCDEGIYLDVDVSARFQCQGSTN